MAHGHRGRKPPNATPDAVVSDVIRLARTRYGGVNHTYLSKLLSEREGIDIGRTTLRRILVNAGLSSPRRRRPPRHRVRRQRMPRAGMLIQLDGSHHRWLGDQAPPFALLIAVDDATGTVVDATAGEPIAEPPAMPELALVGGTPGAKVSVTFLNEATGPANIVDAGHRWIGAKRPGHLP